MKAALEEALRDFAGADVPVMVRTADQMEAAWRASPFQDESGNQVAVIFLDQPPQSDVLAGMTGRQNEVVSLGDREIYVHYPRGMGRSKFRFKVAALGTARNMNTVKRLVEIATA